MSHILVRLDKEDIELDFTVVHAFTPVTTSQVFTVLTPANTPSHLPFPPSSLIILKVFDPKYYPHRLTSAGLPWNIAAETSAASARTAPFDPSFQPRKRSKKEDLVGWEEWYYQLAEMQFRCESSAYERLASLQGTTIPRCFGSGALSLASERRAISPHVLLLEYIQDAKCLEVIDPSVVDRSLGLALMKTAQRFGELGVVHTDLNPSNILFAPATCPTRAVVIDFADSGVREEDEDSDYWAESLGQARDLRIMGSRLKRYLGMSDLM